MKKNKLFLFFFLIISQATVAQNANSWIQYNQEYYKISLAETGMYRLSAVEMQNAGIPIATLAPEKYQIFRRGEELAITVQTTSGNLDYIEFFGQKNDGISDTPLYKSSDAQMHQEYNLFTDTASYFLTWRLDATNGKRIPSSQLSPSANDETVDYHFEEQRILETTRYNYGVRYGSDNSTISSEYDYGEGWIGSLLGKGQVKKHTFSFTNLKKGIKGTLHIALVGWSSLQHNLDLEVGADQDNLRKVGNVKFSKASNKSIDIDFESSDISSGNTLLLSINNVGYTGAGSYVAAPLIKLHYPQELTFESAQASKMFRFKGLSTSNPTTFDIATTLGNALTLYDVSLPNEVKKIAPQIFSDRLTYILPPSIPDKKLYVVKTPKTVPSLSKITMTKPDVANKDLLIVTHAALHKLASDGLDPIQAYVDYRMSDAGGNIPTLSTNIGDLYNQFNYGDPSPLGIVNYLKYAVKNGNPKAVFIIGKGHAPYLGYYRDTKPTKIAINVPSFGHPGGDMMYARGLGQDKYEIHFGVGRLNAQKSEEVKTYLDKVKEMEAQSFTNLNKKKVLLLSGGQSVSELALFKNYIDDFKMVVEGDFLGGEAIIATKKSTDAVEVINIVEEVNDGVGLITLFGHSSGSVNDIEIGRVSQSSFGYNNTGNYPFILINGCNAGSIFYEPTNVTFGEDWLMTPKLGAIGVIAHTAYATPTNLKRYSDNFFNFSVGIESTFGEPIGNTIQRVCKNYLSRYGWDPISMTQVFQTQLQGDPMVKLFGANKPDYFIDSEGLTAKTLDDRIQIKSIDDAFKIEINLKNFGRTSKDSLKIKVQRTLPNGDLIESEKKFKRPFANEKISFLINNNLEKNSIGNNKFTIILDPDNAIDELNENNNRATFHVPIYSGNTSHLFPLNYSIVGDPNIEFVWQPTLSSQPQRAYEFEIDTTHTFSSLFLKKNIVTGTQLIRLKINLESYNLKDSTVLYWRTRFANPQNDQEKNWETTSFCFIENVTGWGQFNHTQLGEGTVEGIVFDNPNTWSFKTTKSPFKVTTFGTDYPSFDYENLDVTINNIDHLITSNIYDLKCAQNTLNAVILDKETTIPLRLIEYSGADVFNRYVCGRLPQVIYNLRENDILGSEAYLETLIDKMEKGDYILLFSLGTVNYSHWDEDVLDALENVGVNKSEIASLTDGQPVIILGKKNASVGSAQIKKNNGTTTPLKEQSLTLEDFVEGQYTQGQIESHILGPAKEWKHFYFHQDLATHDSFHFQIEGVKQDGSLFPLFSNLQKNTELNTLDAHEYPYLKLSYALSDDVDLSPPVLKNWLITYENCPDGILSVQNPTKKYVSEGEKINYRLLIHNYSKFPFEKDLLVKARITNEKGQESTQEQTVPKLKAGDSIAVSLNLESKNQRGLNNFYAEIFPNENENFKFNNKVLLLENIEVDQDNTNPIVTVTFDGHNIMNGEIVSPNPTIKIVLKDDNTFLKKSDTLGLEIMLKKPCVTCDFEKIYFKNNDALTYIPATENQDFEIAYLPGPLQDGVYTLSIQARDVSGNLAGEEPYKVDFEVVEKASISHFYPYPNPFSTSTKFVFTLTGTSLPEKIKIQIMTISGRIVREINQYEIGPLKIGHNITEFAWDGTDSYGDPLANGVYFYRVLIESNTSFDHRSTDADGIFKKGFGKLYILR